MSSVSSGISQIILGVNLLFLLLPTSSLLQCCFLAFSTNFGFVQFHYYFLFCYLSGMLLQPPLEEEGFENS